MMLLRRIEGQIKHGSDVFENMQGNQRFVA